jgi:hypothetical protein
MRKAGPSRPLSNVCQQRRDLADQATLVLVGQPGLDLGQRYPRDLGDLDVLVGELTALREQDVMVDGLVDALSVGDEPEVDYSQRRRNASGNAGLLGHLADGCGLRGLPVFQVAFRQRPQQPAPAIEPSDKSTLRSGGPTIEDETTGGGFLDPIQPASPRRGLRCRRARHDPDGTRLR